MCTFWILLLIFPLITIAGKCPKMGIYSELFQACIVVSPPGLPFATGQSYCQYLGGTLAVVDNSEKNDELVRLSALQVQYDQLVYIGAYTKNGTFQWVDGTVFDYNNFGAYTKPYDDKAVVVQLEDGGNDDKGIWFLMDKASSYGFSCAVPSCDDHNNKTLNIQETYPGFIYSQPFNEWYVIYNVMSDRYMAEPICQSLGGTLPIIMNAFQNVDVSRALKEADTQFPKSRPHHLLGATADTNGTWTWDNGIPVAYTNWGPGEPKQFCDEMKIDVTTGYWSAMITDYAGFTCVLPEVPNVCI